MTWTRLNNRLPNQLRPLEFIPNFTSFAAASVLTRSGKTQVLCNVTINPGVPRFLEGTGKGWLSAEYRMLPAATPNRQEREVLKINGRTHEIQRLIGRSLRGALDFTLLGERTILIDADVLQADAGTRVASINGGYVALSLAIKKLLASGELIQSPLKHQIAAISVGLINNQAFLDLDYQEDHQADIDFNLVMNEQLNLIEIQGTAEAQSFSRTQLNQILDLAETGITQILNAQNQVQFVQ